MRLASFSIKMDGWKAVFQSMLLQANYAVAAKDLRVCRPLVNVREKTLANFAKENRHEVYGESVLITMKKDDKSGVYTIFRHPHVRTGE